jgi:hypothetical protein
LKEIQMTASKILSAVAVALMAVAGAAHAETYEGVHQLTSAASRAEVASQAVVAAPIVASTVDRATVRAAARAAARGDALPL